MSRFIARGLGGGLSLSRAFWRACAVGGQLAYKLAFSMVGSPARSAASLVASMLARQKAAATAR